jgi:hypothetical protein
MINNPILSYEPNNKEDHHSHKHQRGENDKGDFYRGHVIKSSLRWDTFKRMFSFAFLKAQHLLSIYGGPIETRIQRKVLHQPRRIEEE